MSLDTNANDIATYEGFVLANRSLCAVTALVVYEYLITFKYEVDFLWRRKWSAATWIFVLNRYLMLANGLSSIVPYGPHICGDTLSMRVLDFFTSVAVLQVPNHAFTILRCFALLQNHSWRLPVTWTLTTLALAICASETFLNLAQTWVYVDDPLLGSSCYSLGYSIPSSIVQRYVFQNFTATSNNLYAVVPVLSVNKADVAMSITVAAAVLVVTLMTTARQLQQASSLGLKTTLSEVLLRDGSIIFLLDLLYGIVSAVTNTVEFMGPTAAIIGPLVDVLPQILLSRFIINLREVDSPTADPSGSHHSSRFSIPNFRMPTMHEVIGNLGEPLDFVEYRVEDDERDGRDVDAQIERMNLGVEQQGTFGAASPDVEAAGASGSGSSSILSS